MSIRHPDQSIRPAAVPWQIRLFKKSLKKKIKWRILEALIPPGLDGSTRCLDLGCAKGTMSYLLRTRGGMWVSADLDEANLKATQGLVGDSVCRLDYREFPFANQSIDLVVSLDFLEHIEEDDRCLAEMVRVLKPGGRLYLSTPATGRFFMANRLRDLAGLTLEDYGHVREGYSIEDLAGRLRALGLTLEHQSSYSRFFTECLELMLNVYYVRKARRRDSTKARDGAITPGSDAEIQSMRKALRLYSVIYPFFWIISRLDALLFFTSGYALMLTAIKASSKEATSPG